MAGRNVDDRGRPVGNTGRHQPQRSGADLQAQLQERITRQLGFGDDQTATAEQPRKEEPDADTNGVKDPLNEDLLDRGYANWRVVADDVGTEHVRARALEVTLIRRIHAYEYATDQKRIWEGSQNG